MPDLIKSGHDRTSTNFTQATRARLRTWQAGLCTGVAGQGQSEAWQFQAIDREGSGFREPGTSRNRAYRETKVVA